MTILDNGLLFWATLYNTQYTLKRPINNIIETLWTSKVSQINS